MGNLPNVVLSLPNIVFSLSYVVFVVEPVGSSSHGYSPLGRAGIKIEGKLDGILGRSGSKNDKEEEESGISSVGDGLQWWVILLITLAIVVAIFILVKCCVELQTYNFGGGKKLCYLCLQKVALSEWKSGAHRRQCAFKNSMDLNILFQHNKVKCPQCDNYLRLWPEQESPGFTCDSEGGNTFSNCLSKGKQISSTGKNRYNCFVCDYDLCEPCTQTQAQLNDQRGSISTSQKVPNNQRSNSKVSLGQVSGKAYDVEKNGDVSRRQSKVAGRTMEVVICLDCGTPRTDYLRIEPGSKNERRCSKASSCSSCASRRYSNDILEVVKTNSDRRASSAAYMRSQMHIQDEAAQNKSRRTSRDTNCKTQLQYKQNDNAALHKRRKSHADILNDSMLLKPENLITNHTSRRYSQVEMRDILAIQSSSVYQNSATTSNIDGQTNTIPCRKHSTTNLDKDKKVFRGSKDKHINRSREGGLQRSREGGLQRSREGGLQPSRESRLHSVEDGGSHVSLCEVAAGSRESLIASSRDKLLSNSSERLMNNFDRNFETVLTPPSDTNNSPSVYSQADRRRGSSSMKESVFDGNTEDIAISQHNSDATCTDFSSDCEDSQLTATELNSHIDALPTSRLLSSNSHSSRHPSTSSTREPGTGSSRVPSTSSTREPGAGRLNIPGSSKLDTSSLANRRRSLMPGAEQDINGLNYHNRRRNSSAIIIIRNPEQFGLVEGAPIIVNKEDGLPKRGKF